MKLQKTIFFDDGLDSLVWCDCFLEFSCSLDSKVAIDVLSSLTKKGFIYPISKDSDKDYIKFTDKGRKYLTKEFGIEE